MVTRNADFEAEGNDSIATAQKILSPDVGGRRWIVGAINSPKPTKFINAFDSGCYNELGNVSNAYDYFTGFVPRWQYGTGTYRGYFVFDLSGLTSNDTILDASFEVLTGKMWFLEGNETLQLSEVSTPVDVLTAREQGRTDIFDDLGDGVLYGSRSVSWSDWSILNVELNDDAVAALNDAKGDQFAMGSAISTINFDGDVQAMFAYTSDPNYTKQLVLSLEDNDYYAITADAGKTIEIETQTPASKAGEFQNGLDPIVRLYDSTGRILATDDNGAVDRRNAKLSYKVPKNAGGTFYIQVAPSPAAGQTTRGEYFLSVKGTTVKQPPFTVVETDPANKSRVYKVPQQLEVSFNDTISTPTLQAADLLINGKPARGVMQADGDTAMFDTPNAYKWSDNGHYYFLTSKAQTWAEAEAEAVARGGHLVSVNSQAENDFLRQTFLSGPDRSKLYWLGLNDLEVEGEYVWSSGEEVTY